MTGKETPIRRLEVLYVNAAVLPETDSRVGFGASSRSTRVTFASSIEGDEVDLPSARLLTDDQRGVGIGFFARLTRYLWRHRRDFDFVHFFTTKLVIAGPVLSSIVGVPCLMTITGMGRGMGRALTQPGPRSRLYIFAYRTLMTASVRLATACFFENRGQLERFRSWFPDQADKFVYVGGGVSQAHVRPRAPAASPDLVVLHVARLDLEKGTLDFIRVARSLQGSGLRFVLVGEVSPRHRRIAAAVREAAADGVLEYLGRLPHRRVWDEYARAHILLFPSTATEGLPRVLMEAGLAGLCPVAYAIEGTTDAIRPGRGFLVDAGDVRAVEEVLRELVRNRPVLETNATAFRSHVEEHFSIEAFTERLDVAMNRLDGGHRVEGA